MRNMQVIPTTVHGVLDYLVGLLLIVGPWVFAYNDVNAAKWASIIVGVIVLATSLMTNYELGVMRIVPMHVHLVADTLVGIFLILAPWILGFGDEGTNAWLPFVVIGVGELGAVAMSERVPRRQDLARRERNVVRQAA
jgi:SPW repeat